MSWEPDFDGALLRELAGVLSRAETVPPDVVRQAKAARAWRDISASIALLEYDSLVDDDDDLARVRAAGAERTLIFRVDETVIRLAVLDGGRRLAGQLTPASFARVEVRQPGGVRRADVDSLGVFLVDGPLSGALSLRCTPAEAGRGVVETEWVTV